MCPGTALLSLLLGSRYATVRQQPTLQAANQKLQPQQPDSSVPITNAQNRFRIHQWLPIYHLPPIKSSDN